MQLLAHRLPEPALAAFERARLLDPAAPNWHYYAGVIHQERKEYPAAKAAFEAFLALDPESFAAKVRLAEVLFESGDKAASIERFRAALEQRPAAPRACFGMGLTLLADNKPAAARPYFERALSAFPRYHRARAALAEGYEAARKTTGGPAPPFDDPLMADMRRLDAGPSGTRREAQQLARNGRVAKAVALLEGALRGDPEQAGYHADLMMYFTQLKQWEKAGDHFRAMVNANPDDAIAHAGHGDMLVAQGKCEEAVEAFDTALQVDPAMAAAHQALGSCQAKLGRAAAAESHFRKAVELEPGLLAAQASLGEMLVSQSKFAEAIPHLLAANSAHGEERARVLYALGVAYERTGKPAEAAATLESARVVAEAYGPKRIVDQLAKRGRK